MRISSIVLLICIITINSLAQPSADSLFQRLNSSNPQEKVDIYLAIAKVYWRYSTDSIYKYSHKALDMAKETKYVNGEAKALSYIGVTYFYRASYDSVIYYYNEAVKKFKESNDLGGAAITMNNTGVLYKRLGDYTQALNCYTEAMAIQESLGDVKEVGGTLLNIGIIYFVQNRFDDALSYYLKALEKFELIDDKIKIAGAYTNIGQVYAELNKNDEALDYYQKALIIQKESDDKYGIANSLSNIGIINKTNKNYIASEISLKQSADLYTEMHDEDAIAFVYNHLGELYTFMQQWDKALDMYTKTIHIEENIGDDEGLAYVRLDLANFHFQKKEWAQAISNLNQSIGLSRKLHILDILQNSYLLLSRIDSARGRYAESLAHFKKYSLYKDSIYNEESSRQIAEMQTKYETTKKEQEIIKLQQERIVSELKIKNSRMIWASGMVATVAVFILFFMIYRVKQRKLKTKLLLKNTMETEDKERKRFAEELHDGIGPLLSTVKMYVNELDNEQINSSTRRLLNESNKIIDDTIGAVRNLSHNLMPRNIEKYGLVKSLQNSVHRVCIKGSPEIILETGKIGNYGKWQQVMIYRIITELINNSIKHASTSVIKVNMNETDKNLTILYEDTGEGFNVEKALNSSDGIGLTNIVSRIKSLDGAVVFNSEKGKGFKARMEFNIKNLNDIKLN
ncbi:MAG: tetratricopeptide repeat protein [Bacteroidales bacterium]|nr:tetratricopeptide repeat protein [Bacteroidales bacterium]